MTDYCRNGHPYTRDTTYYRSIGGRTVKDCLVCKRLRQREYAERRHSKPTYAAGCRMASDAGIAATDLANYRAAEEGSRALLEAINRMRREGRA